MAHFNYLPISRLVERAKHTLKKKKRVLFAVKVRFLPVLEPLSS